jgi:hypothetical protein
MLPDEHIEVINWNAGVSKPRIRKILEIAAEIELDLKIADIQQRTGKKPVDSSAAAPFTPSHIPASSVGRNPLRPHD